MNTAEKIQAAILAVLLVFVAYIAMYAVQTTVERRNRAPARIELPKPRTAPPEKPSPKRKASKKSAKGREDAKELFTRGLGKATAGDCVGATADLQKAASLDASFKDQIPSALDACKQK